MGGTLNWNRVSFTVAFALHVGCLARCGKRGFVVLIWKYVFGTSAIYFILKPIEGRRGRTQPPEGLVSIDSNSTSILVQIPADLSGLLKTAPRPCLKSLFNLPRERSPVPTASLLLLKSEMQASRPTCSSIYPLARL